MLLTIDIGNTNINFAVFTEKGRVAAKWRVATIHNRTADEYSALLSQLMSVAAITPAKIEAIIVSTVVPQLMIHITKFCRTLFDKDPLVVGEELKYPIKIKIDDPKEVGADRVVNAVGAFKLYNASAIIIDFGTATTFDVVTSEGDYAGGVIATGINLSLHALQEFAAKLPNIPIEKPKKVIGTNTKAAMQSGIYWGYIGLVEGVVARMKEEMTEKPLVIATGGLAPLFATSTKAIDKTEPDLTLIGLFEIYKRSRT